MDDGGRVSERLDEIRHQGVFEERSHGTLGLKVAGVYGLSVICAAHVNVAEPLLKVL